MHKEVVYFIMCLLFAGLFIQFIIHTDQYKNKVDELTNRCVKPASLRELDAQRQIVEIQSELNEKDEEIFRLASKLSTIQNKYIGEFEKIPLGDTQGSCIKIGNDTKGAFNVLTKSSSCADEDDVKIFSYNNENRQVKVGDNFCIDAVNENDVILSNCIKSSQRQLFQYYPYVDGKLKSSLYNKCLGVNSDSIVELQECNLDTNIVVPQKASLQ